MASRAIPNPQETQPIRRAPMVESGFLDRARLPHGPWQAFERDVARRAADTFSLSTGSSRRGPRRAVLGRSWSASASLPWAPSLFLLPMIFCMRKTALLPSALCPVSVAWLAEFDPWGLAARWRYLVGQGTDVGAALDQSPVGIWRREIVGLGRSQAPSRNRSPGPLMHRSVA